MILRIDDHSLRSGDDYVPGRTTLYRLDCYDLPTFRAQLPADYGTRAFLLSVRIVVPSQWHIMT